MIRSRFTELLNEQSRRAGRKITQKEVAEAIGVEEATLSKWAYDRPLAQMRSNTIILLCKYFNCTIGDLLYIDNSKSESGDPENETRSTPNAA